MGKEEKRLAELCDAFARGDITQDELDEEVGDILGMKLKPEDEELAEVWERERRTKCQSTK